MDYVTKFKNVNEIEIEDMIHIEMNEDSLREYISNYDDVLEIKITKEALKIINQFIENMYKILVQSKNTYFLIEKVGIYFGEDTDLYQNFTKFYFESYENNYHKYGIVLQDTINFVFDEFYQSIYGFAVDQKLEKIDENEAKTIIEELKQTTFINFK